MTWRSSRICLTKPIKCPSKQVLSSETRTQPRNQGNQAVRTPPWGRTLLTGLYGWHEEMTHTRCRGRCPDKCGYGVPLDEIWCSHTDGWGAASNTTRDAWRRITRTGPGNSRERHWHRSSHRTWSKLRRSPSSTSWNCACFGHSRGHLLPHGGGKGVMRI